MELIQTWLKASRLWLVLVTLSLLVTACGSSDSLQSTDPPPNSPPGLTVGDLRVHPVWQLIDYGPEGAPVTVLPGSSITLSFQVDGQLGGSGGCNQYSASFVIQGQTLTVGSVSSTLIACLDQGLNGQESDYLQILEGFHQVTLSQDSLTLSSQGGRLRFRPESP